MTLEVRRIVTGHDSQGKAVVATDERLAGTGAVGRAGISRVDVWSTDKMPIDNSDAAAELQRKGFVVRHNYVGSGQGSVCRVVPPAARRSWIKSWCVVMRRSRARPVQTLVSQVHFAAA